MRKVILMVSWAIISTLMLGCSTKLNFLPEYQPPNQHLSNFSPITTKIITVDARVDRIDSENLTLIVDRSIKEALDGSLNTGIYTIYINIIKHESTFSSATWYGNTQFQVTVQNNPETIISKFIASGYSSKYNLLGYLTAQAASQESFNMAINDLIYKLSLIASDEKQNLSSQRGSKSEISLSVSKNNSTQISSENKNVNYAEYSDTSIYASLSPIFVSGKGVQSGGYRAFTLTIQNKTDNELYLSWDKSYFIENGEAQTGFFFEGIKYTDRDAPKKDLLIMPKTTIKREIFPNSKVIFIPYDRTAESIGIPTGWLHKSLEGECGGYFKIRGDKYNKSIKLLLIIN